MLTEALHTRHMYTQTHHTYTCILDGCLEHISDLQDNLPNHLQLEGISTVLRTGTSYLVGPKSGAGSTLYARHFLGGLPQPNCPPSRSLGPGEAGRQPP